MSFTSTFKGCGKLCMLYLVETTIWSGFFNSFLKLTKTHKATSLEMATENLSQIHKLVMVEIWEDEILKKNNKCPLYKEENEVEEFC